MDFCGNVRVLAIQKLFSVVYHRDSTTEAAKHLGEFQANVSASQNQQMFRQHLQIQNRSGVERFYRIESGDAGPCRPSAGIDKNGVGDQCPSAAANQPNLNNFWTGEMRFAENELDVLRIFQEMLYSCTELVHDALLASIDLRQVDSDLATTNAVVRCASGQ